MEEVFAVIFIFGTPVLIVFTVFLFRYLQRNRASQVLEKMIDSGQELNPDLVKSISIQPKRPHGDLKIALILFGIALGLIFLGAGIPEDEVGPIMAGIAAIPGMIGVAYLVFWGLISRKQDTPA